MKYHHTLEPDEAKRRIEECIYKHPGSKTSEITDSLRINPEQAMDILNDLKKEGRHIILSKYTNRGSHTATLLFYTYVHLNRLECTGNHLDRSQRQ